MGEEHIFGRINGLLKSEGLSEEINSLQQLKSFLNDGNNMKLRTYGEIRELFDLLVVGPGMW